MNSKYYKYRWMWILFAPVILVVVGLVVMTLWNWLIPAIFNGPMITFWQALGILLLSKILTGGPGGGGSRHKRYSSRSDWRKHMQDHGHHSHYDCGPIAAEDVTVAPTEQENNDETK